MLKCYTCTDHDGVWLPGVSVVFAKSQEHARQLLDEALKERDLKTEDYTLEFQPSSYARALVLFDGDY